MKITFNESAGDQEHLGHPEDSMVVLEAEAHGETPEQQKTLDRLDLTPATKAQAPGLTKNCSRPPALVNHLKAGFAKKLLSTNSSSQVLYRRNVPLMEFEETEADSGQPNSSVACFPGGNPVTNAHHYNKMLKHTKAGKLQKTDLQNWAVNLGRDLNNDQTLPQTLGQTSSLEISGSNSDESQESVDLNESEFENPDDEYKEESRDDLTENDSDYDSLAEFVDNLMALASENDYIGEELKEADRKRHAPMIKSALSTSIKSAKTPRVELKTRSRSSSHF